MRQLEAVEPFTAPQVAHFQCPPSATGTSPTAVAVVAEDASVALSEKRSVPPAGR